MRRLRLLVVAEGEEAGSQLSAAMEQLGCDCERVRGLASVTEVLRRSSVEAIVYLAQGAELHDEALGRHAGREEGSVPLVVVARTATLRGAVGAIKGGAFDYLAEPVDPAQVRAALDQALAASEGQRRRAPPEMLVGEDAAMRGLMMRVEQVSRSSAPVLLQGESGTGKELVARAIHDRSPRSDRAFVAVNAAAIPEALLESELFGHVKGAFTGASRSHPGLLQQAHGGTLLLDEIGDMPLALQAKLLRVLQEGEVRAVGGDVTHHVDVRVIAATHRDLLQMAQAGLFREDLYFRLNVIPLYIPPLRQRRGDIPLLAHYLLQQARTRSPASPVREFSPDAMLRLQEARWHGNVRELGSTIERLVVLGSERVISAEFLGTLMPLAADESLPKAGEPRDECFVAHMPEAPWSLKQLTSGYVAWVLAKTEGNKMRAAQILGINLSTLYRWVKPLAPS